MPGQTRTRRSRSRIPTSGVRWWRTGVPLAAFVLIVLIGGSVQIPVWVLTGQIAAAIAIGWWVAFARAEDWRSVWPVLVCAAACLALGAWQLAPRSPADWAAMPGHATAAAIADLSGTVAPRPLSLDPQETQACLVFLVVGFAAAIAAISARSPERALFTRAVIAIALASALLGALQLASGGGFRLYADSHDGNSIGIFANRNHHADFLLIAMLLLVAEIRAYRGRRVPPLALGLWGFLALSVVMTGSRLGMAILPFALIAGVLMLYARPGSSLWIAVAALFGIVLVMLLLAFLTPSAHHMIERYGTLGHDPRYAIWTDTRAAIGAFWPSGSGLGTFVPVYKGFETLDGMQDRYVVHAHNDYLEILLEAGLPGLILLVGYGLALAVAAVRAIASPRRAEVVPALLGVLVLLVHSFGDFPLRTPGLTAIFGLLNGIMFGREVYHNRANNPAAPQNGNHF